MPTKLKLRPYDSMLAEFVDPELAPDLMLLRERIRSWRFYDQVRTDAEAPMRGAQVGTRTPVLGHDGADLAAALQTIREIGDAGGPGRRGRPGVPGQPAGHRGARRPVRADPEPARDAPPAGRR